MLGAGVFVAFGPAAESAGTWLPAALLVAGMVAYCNAASSAQLAQVYPAAGGTYVYGREQLGHWQGFIAGWGYVTGKTASCAAMALTFGYYAAPDYAVPLAVAAVVVLTAVNLFGITRTALLTRILLAVVLAVLAFAVAVMFTAPAADTTAAAAEAGPAGVLQAAGLLFFAFAGYARIATLGEEVVNPQSSIPKAILGALAIAFLIYLLIGSGLLRTLGTAGLAGSTAPLLEATGPAAPWAGPVVAAGAACASLGALLALVAGVGRTTMAMARERDLPTFLARIGSRFTVPYRADLTVAVVIIVLLLTTDVLTVVGFSSFGVLIYYAVANLAALTLRDRPWHAPKAVNVIGLAGCLVLAFTLPLTSVLVISGIMAAGLAGRWLVLRRRAALQRQD